MVKRMRKAKTSSGDEVAVVDKASSLGVRTRAKTMARSGDDGCNYLQLRSRRLERRVVPLVRRAKKNKKYEKGGDFYYDKKHEACFGENELDEIEIKTRISRESTPSNFIVGSKDIPKTPTSSNRAIYNVRVVKKITNVVPKILSAEQLEVFFAAEEKNRIEKFIKQYNFDPVNEKPLEGRYEWAELKP
ncbi:hypothetical protein ABFS82_07G063400 [Erythranthe guttata]